MEDGGVNLFNTGFTKEQEEGKLACDFLGCSMGRRHDDDLEVVVGDCCSEASGGSGMASGTATLLKILRTFTRHWFDSDLSVRSVRILCDIYRMS